MMILDWKGDWKAWGIDFNDSLTTHAISFHRKDHGYAIYSDQDGLYLYLVDMDGNVGRFDVGDTPYEDFEDWLALALDQIDMD